MKKYLPLLFMMSFVMYSCKTMTKSQTDSNFVTHENKAIHLKYSLPSEFEQEGDIVISVLLDESISNVESRYINQENTSLKLTYYPEEKGAILYDAFQQELKKEKSLYQIQKSIQEKGVTYFLSKKISSLDGKGNPIKPNKELTCIDFYKEEYGYYNVEIRQVKTLDLHSFIQSISFIEK